MKEFNQTSMGEYLPTFTFEMVIGAVRRGRNSFEEEDAGTWIGIGGMKREDWRVEEF